MHTDIQQTARQTDALEINHAASRVVRNRSNKIGDHFRNTLCNTDKNKEQTLKKITEYQ